MLLLRVPRCTPETHAVRKLRSAAFTESVATEPDDVLPRPITAHPHLGLPRNGRVIR